MFSGGSYDEVARWLRIFTQNVSSRRSVKSATLSRRTASGYSMRYGIWRKSSLVRGAMGGLSLQLFDIGRVEVLRGPQGTLYGRNSTGGLVHFISEKPSEDFQAYAQIDGGSYDQVKFEGAIGGALGETVSARASLATNISAPRLRVVMSRMTPIARCAVPSAAIWYSASARSQRSSPVSAVTIRYSTA